MNSEPIDTGNNGAADSGDGEPRRRRYSAPVILSREPLEAIAAVCPPAPTFPDPPIQFGKPQGPGCFNPGS